MDPNAEEKNTLDAGNAETRRLDKDARRVKNWKRWGPYLSDKPVGDGARGPLPRRLVVGFFPPRPTPAPGPTPGARTAFSGARTASVACGSRSPDPSVDRAGVEHVRIRSVRRERTDGPNHRAVRNTLHLSMKEPGRPPVRPNPERHHGAGDIRRVFFLDQWLEQQG